MPPDLAGFKISKWHICSDMFEMTKKNKVNFGQKLASPTLFFLHALIFKADLKKRKHGLMNLC